MVVEKPETILKSTACNFNNMSIFKKQKPCVESPENNGILVVGDSEDIADLVKDQLSPDGHNVHEFYDPLATLDYFKENPKRFALVI